jgi:hypothetical protein
MLIVPLPGFETLYSKDPTFCVLVLRRLASKLFPLAVWLVGIVIAEGVRSVHAGASVSVT